MRYTTVIDISEFPEVYRNISVRTLYFHLALKSGWHDDDRDRLKASIRTLAADAGLTVSATRHAVMVLTRAKLLAREADGRWYVKKWTIDTPPSPRPKKGQGAGLSIQTEEEAAQEYREKKERELKQWQQNVKNAVRACDRAELAAWLEEMRQKKITRHHGVVLNPNANNIRWMEGVIEKL